MVNEQTALTPDREATTLGLVGRFVGAVVTVALVVTWVLLFRPPVLGGTASFVGVNGISMTGTFSNGSLAVVEKESSYHIGDIIAYKIPAGEPGTGQNVIHRIVGGNGTTGFITKGDHNSYTDHFWHPKTADVIGRVWFVIPGGATWLATFREPAVLGLVVGLVSFALIAWPSRRGDSTHSESHGEVGNSDEEEVEPVSLFEPASNRR